MDLTEFKQIVDQIAPDTKVFIPEMLRECDLVGLMWLCAADEEKRDGCACCDR